MTDLNLGISVLILVLAGGLGIYHVSRFGLHVTGVAGITVLVLALLGMVTALGAWLPGPQDYLAFIAAALRGVALVLLVSLGLYHWRED